MNTLEKRLQRLLDSFKLPENKKHDLLWLKKNAHVGNTGHRDLPEVKKLINQLLVNRNNDRVKHIIK